MFGVLTTVVSIGTYYVFAISIGMNELIANVISWVVAVAFAYVTNRKWVFKSSARGFGAILREAAGFFGGRLLTLALEEAFIFVFITLLDFNSMIVKIAAQVFVVIGNYVISKWLVFRK